MSNETQAPAVSALVVDLLDAIARMGGIPKGKVAIWPNEVKAARRALDERLAALESRCSEIETMAREYMDQRDNALQDVYELRKRIAQLEADPRRLDYYVDHPGEFFGFEGYSEWQWLRDRTRRFDTLRDAIDAALAAHPETT